ncbi:pentatricopeptide repeat-containing protein At1g31920 [Malania oleifera]|uniref:pentatricopeptide repeat-containing protein At1g31920 n=1 Tax=Malania oleifera TaxID=397392 RepID=UPI0025AEC8FB|nr:pentatricopeptide repeat-containing protein At1g31920 [Malania oleifera]XP_057977395.1 pentatricopeptide repeat-containing protein At1g31920 [Malania oleifera]
MNIGASVLHQTHSLAPQNPEFSLGSRENECVSMLKKCRNMEEFKQVHAQILKLGLFWNSFCAGNLIVTCALSNWGSMEYACSVFRELDEPTSYEFNAMIRGHVKDMNSEEALHLYEEMVERGVEPDNFTYPTLLKACTGLFALEEGMQVHGHIFKLGLEDNVFVQNSLVNMYGKCGEIELSCAMFEQMDQKSVASWSALISAHASLGMWSECLRLFGEMNREGCWRAEESTLVSVLSACTHLGALHLGRCIHGSLLRNISGLNIIVETSLIDMYIKCGCLEKGWRLFQKMAKRNQLSYTVIILGFALHGHGQEALRVFSEMLQAGLKPDNVTYVGVLSACSHAGLVKEGLQCFDRMKFEHRIEPTLQHYGCMVELLGRAGKLKEAFELIKSMPMEPNDVVWRSLLGACKVHQELEIGELAAKKLFQLKTQNAGDYLALSNIYARARRWEDVAMVRTEMFQMGMIQTLGFSMVEVNRKVYKFVSQDKSHPQCQGVYEMLHQMEWQLKFEGYSPDTTQVLLDVDEDEKRWRLSGHSQKLAIAFALIHTSQGSPIRIVRNIGMCSDCHTYTKLISMIYQRTITVRDRNRFHHFKDGTCSCRDCW